jgi:hypothetical protein
MSHLTAKTDQPFIDLFVIHGSIITPAPGMDNRPYGLDQYSLHRVAFRKRDYRRAALQFDTTTGHLKNDYYMDRV